MATNSLEFKTRPYVRLVDRPDIEKLIQNGQISQVQNEIYQVLTEEYSLEIIQEYALYNEAYPSSPYRADFFLPKFGLCVEIDGKPFHQNPEKEKRKTSAVHKHGLEQLRIPFEIPNYLIYGKLKGKARDLVKAKYEDWKQKEIQKMVDVILDSIF